MWVLPPSFKLIVNSPDCVRKTRVERVRGRRQAYPVPGSARFVVHTTLFV